MTPQPEPGAQRTLAGTWLEVLRAFLRLGLTSFGGPVAHLGYFREEFVVRRRWLDDRAYADLVALCQFLPGPASTQVWKSPPWLVVISCAAGGWLLAMPRTANRLPPCGFCGTLTAAPAPRTQTARAS